MLGQIRTIFIGGRGHMKKTPFGVLDYIVNSENGYGGVHVDYLDAKNLLIKYFLPVMIVFTIIAFSVIGVIKSKERRGRL